jgi:hypothetical protein
MEAAAELSPDGQYKSEKRKIFEGHMKTLKEEIGIMFLAVILAFIIGACLLWALRGLLVPPWPR